MTTNIINISEMYPSWNWLNEEFKDPNLHWQHYSSKTAPIPKIIPKHESIARAYAALGATVKARSSDSILVSHGPRSTMYVSSFAKKLCPETPHLAFSFTFTDLPTGKQRSVMAKAYQQPAKFVCFSTLERKLYSDYFDIPIESIDMVYWSVHAPKINPDEKPTESGRYICALGSQGRDYKTLFAAMKKLPGITLIVVTTAESIAGLEIPNNVKVRSNIPLAQAFNILMFSEFMVLPLRDSQVPCGHSTLVSSMFFKKTCLVTRAESVYDYVENEKTGLFFEPNDTPDLIQKIESLWENTANTFTMNEAAYTFANTYCTEKSAVDYFRNFLKVIERR